MLPESLLEVTGYTGLGYRPVVDYAEWRVAVLRFHPELLPENITTMQRHDATDEVFVLLAGQCVLFVGEGDETISAMYAQPMEPLKVYNVKRSVWHSHSLSEDAVVLIVENRTTTPANSPTIELTQAHQKVLQTLAARWLYA